MKISNFIVFNTTREHGQMNSAALFYKEGLSGATRVKLMREHKGEIASQVGFDINKIFMSLQSNKNHSYMPGTSYTLTKEDVENYEDLYDYDVWADTVKVTPDTPNCVIGFNVSDAPNIIAMNRKTKEATSTYCSGAHVNNEVPAMIKETLGGDASDIVVSISPFAHMLPWVGEELESEPAWISNKDAWKDCVEKHGSMVFINQKKAILKQLLNSGIKPGNIIVGEDSFYNATKYYSSQRNRMKKTMEDGRFMHGVLLQDMDSEEWLENYPELSLEVMRDGNVQPNYSQDYIKVISMKR